MSSGRRLLVQERSLAAVGAGANVAAPLRLPRAERLHAPLAAQLGGEGGGHRRRLLETFRRLLQTFRRLQGFFSQRFGASAPGCTWDEIDDISRDVDECAPLSPVAGH